jgi:hypothetical protein
MMQVEYRLNVKNYNGGPSIRIYHNGAHIYDDKLQLAGPQTIRFATEMVFPNKLVLEHYGKNMRRDTQVDQQGNIVNDKGFTIESVKIDDVLLVNELYHFDFVKDDGEVIKKNNYIGFNGKFVIDIDKEDLYQWHSGWQKMLVGSNEIFDYAKFRAEIFSDG